MKINNFKSKFLPKSINSLLLVIFISFLVVSCGPLKPKKTDLRKIPADPKLKREKNIREGRGFRVMGMIEGNKGGGNFQFASSNGHYEIVKLLAPLTDNPNAPGRYAQ